MSPKPIMPAFLRENLPYKIAALVFAILLHFYVVNQQAPARVMNNVPLIVHGLPPHLVLGDDTPRQVMLTLNGPPDELDRLTRSDVTAYVNLAHEAAGRDVTVPVLVSAPDDVRADPTPNSVSLTLMARETRRIPVTATNPGPALPGYRYQLPRISPRYVTVTGSQVSVDSIARVVANAAAAPSVGTVRGDFQIVALDAQGSEVPDVTLTPSHVHVLIHMVYKPAMRNVLVSADITGSLPLNTRITGVRIQPRLVVISGVPSRLSQINSIGTAPIDMTGATGTVTRTVNCVAPPGIVFAGASAVIVTIHVAPSTPSALSVTPTPANPPSAAPAGTAPLAVPTLNGSPPAPGIPLH